LCRDPCDQETEQRLAIGPLGTGVVSVIKTQRTQFVERDDAFSPPADIA
jgi:hypothetical protein